MGHRPDMLFIDDKYRLTRSAPKLRVPRMTVDRSRQQFERRRRRLLTSTAEPEATADDLLDPTQDIQANRAIANLLTGRFVAEANARIRRAAEWFDHPPPINRPIKGPCTNGIYLALAPRNRSSCLRIRRGLFIFG